jgi:hypothetical protein
MGRILHRVRKKGQGMDFLHVFFLVFSLGIIVVSTILYVDYRSTAGREALDPKMLVESSKRIVQATFGIGVWTTLFAAD